MFIEDVWRIGKSGRFLDQKTAPISFMCSLHLHTLLSANSFVHPLFIERARS